MAADLFDMLADEEERADPPPAPPLFDPGVALPEIRRAGPPPTLLAHLCDEPDLLLEDAGGARGMQGLAWIHRKSPAVSATRHASCCSGRKSLRHWRGQRVCG